jgi:hypothetical protein
MKRLLTALAACTALTFVSGLHAQDANVPELVDPDNVLPLMHRKLDRSKLILEGLALEQYDKIASNARSLRLLSMEAGWKVIQTEEYRKQSEDFRRACDSIERAAKAKDVNRAALGYVALTVRCVECHTYMRENKLQVAKLDAEQ